MDSKSFKLILVDALRTSSGLESHRNYLGMSSISQCPRKLYFDFVEGRESFSDEAHWRCWTGYLHEAAVIGLMDEAGLLNSAVLATQEPKGKLTHRQTEIVAKFDNRFRGHVDYSLDGDLVEIKSVGWDKFKRMIETGPHRPNVEQIQMYLRHGNYPRCHLVYIARDVPSGEWNGLPLWTFEVLPQSLLAGKLDEKAGRILKAVDTGRPPVCECNWCRR